MFQLDKLIKNQKKKLIQYQKKTELLAEALKMEVVFSKNIIHMSIDDSTLNL